MISYEATTNNIKEESLFLFYFLGVKSIIHIKGPERGKAPKTISIVDRTEEKNTYCKTIFYSMDDKLY